MPTESAVQFVSCMTRLVSQVSNWAAAAGCAVQPVSRTLRDSDGVGYEAPGLLLQHGLTQFALSPQGPGHNSATAEFYLMPRYDDIVTLTYVSRADGIDDDRWHVLPSPWKSGIDDDLTATGPQVFDERLFNRILTVAKRHATV